MEFLTLVLTAVGLVLLLRKDRPTAPVIQAPGLALEPEPLSPADWPEYALGMVTALPMVQQGGAAWKNIVTTFQSAAGLPVDGIYSAKVRDTALQAIRQIDPEMTAAMLPTPEVPQAAPGSMQENT